MILASEYCCLKYALTIWEPHEALLYDHIEDARRRILEIEDNVRTGGSWSDRD